MSDPESFLDPTGLPVIIPNFNRLKLLEQTLTSLFRHSHFPVYPIVIDNGSGLEVQENLQELAAQKLIRYYPIMPQTGIGVARNFGAAIAPATHEFIYFSDNDIFFQGDWDLKMMTVMKELPQIGILGGLRHPYHGINEKVHCREANVDVAYTDQQAGYSMMLRRSLWNEIGPFPLTKPDDYGQEDVNLCDHVRTAGYQIAAIDPGFLLHCGVTRADGTNTIGQKEIKDEIAKHNGVLYE